MCFRGSLGVTRSRCAQCWSTFAVSAVERLGMIRAAGHALLWASTPCAIVMIVGLLYVLGLLRRTVIADIAAQLLLHAIVHLPPLIAKRIARPQLVLIASVRG